jgi:hypothetical protein
MQGLAAKYHEDGGITPFHNVGKHLPVDMA